MPKPVHRLAGDSQQTALNARLRRWEALQLLLRPFDMPAAKEASTASGRGGEIGCTPCSTYRELQEAWGVALEWTEELDHGLTSMLTSIASTGSLGDQLWIKVISCASSGKSVLCEALSVAKKYIVAKSTIRGFHSGCIIDGSADEDNSLVSNLYGKTLITKDGDTILQSPNLQQILSEARDIYDGSSRTHYRNKMGKDYEGLRMTWILCGTSSLRAIDQSELGERFLDCVIMEEIDDELEDKILLRVVERANENVSIEASEDPEQRNDPDMTKAMRLSGGYVEWLRQNAGEVIPTIQNSREAMLKCAKLGKFVAFMRARPSNCQEETAEREFAARLASQLTRYAKCLAFVLNEIDVSERVMDQTAKIAMDTSRGLSLKIADHLFSEENGSEAKAIAIYMGEEIYKIRRMLKFMQKIGIVKTFRIQKIKGIKGQIRWKLSKTFKKLYQTVRSG